MNEPNSKQKSQVEKTRAYRKRRKMLQIQEIKRMVTVVNTVDDMKEYIRQLELEKLEKKTNRKFRIKKNKNNMGHTDRANGKNKMENNSQSSDHLSSDNRRRLRLKYILNSNAPPSRNITLRREIPNLKVDRFEKAMIHMNTIDVAMDDVDDAATADDATAIPLDLTVKKKCSTAVAENARVERPKPLNTWLPSAAPDTVQPTALGPPGLASTSPPPCNAGVAHKPTQQAVQEPFPQQRNARPHSPPGQDSVSLPPPPPPPLPMINQYGTLRPSVVVRSPKFAASAPSAFQAAAKMSPQDASHVSSLDNFTPAMPDPAAYNPLMFSAEYNSFLVAAAAAVAAAGAVHPSLSLPPPHPSVTQYHHHHHHHQQQQQQQQQHHQIKLQQQHQMQQEQQLRYQLRQQQHQMQQQHLLQATYGGGNAYDVNSIMMAQKMAASPLYVATSSPTSSSESNPFPFNSYDSLPRAAYNFGYPYFGGIFGEAKGGGGGGFCSSSGRSDCLSPESTTTDHLDEKMCSLEDDPDVDPEEVAAIYRQTDFVSFRQRYLESLGPPKNFEKMRRSMPNKKMINYQYDQTYIMKRQKNNEAAKRSRDTKRQRYIENQISVMYLTKKVSEMKEIKRRLLMSM